MFNCSFAMLPSHLLSVLSMALLAFCGEAFAPQGLMRAQARGSGISSSSSSSSSGRSSRGSSFPLQMRASEEDGGATGRAVGAALGSLVLGAAVLFGGGDGLPSHVFTPPVAEAVSGGGLDYANLRLTGEDFSNGKYRGKDFSGCIAQEVSFKGSDLTGARFFKSDLTRSDFTGVTGVTMTMEDANLDGIDLTNANLQGAYFGASVTDVKSIEGADFSDCILRKDVVKKLCARPDATGTNPVTGVDTRESLMCP